MPCSGIAWRGSRTTATRTRSRLPTIPLCRIEIDPAGAGQIDLDPSMRVAAAGIVVVVVRDMQISGDKACGHPKRAYRLDHEHGEVTRDSSRFRS